MAIRYVHKSEIDYKKWDSVVNSSKGATIYGLSWFLDAVTDDWCALVKNDYEAILPLVTAKKKGVNIIYQPFFTRYFNVYGTDVSSVVITEFIEAIPEDYKLIDFCVSLEFNYVKNIDVESFMHQELNLNLMYDDLFSAFSTNAKRLVKKAKKNHATLIESQNVELLIQLFKSRKGDQLNFNEENYHHMYQLMQKGLEKGVGRFYEVKIEEKLIAVAYFFITDDRIYYFNGSITDEGQKDGGLYFVMDQVIEQYSGREMILDFGGSKVKEVADFYKKFGAYDVNYSRLSKNTLNPILKKVKKIRDKFKK